MYFKRLELVGFKSFFDKTTLHFEPGITAVVGPNGCGKCLKGDSQVWLSDGKKIEIKSLIDLAVKNATRIDKIDDGEIIYADKLNISVLSLNPESMKVESRPVYAFVKRTAPDYLLEIKTKSGREIVTTGYHPFFTLKQATITALKAEQLEPGIRISLPRAIGINKPNNTLDQLEILKRFSQKDNLFIPYTQELSEFISLLGDKLKIQNSSFREIQSKEIIVRSVISSKQSVNVFNFVNLLKENNISILPEFVQELKSRSSGTINLPLRMNNGIARFLGYLISEGRTNKTNQVWFTNEEDAVVKDYQDKAKASFGVEAKVFNYKKNAKDVLIFSSALVKYLEKAFDFKVDGISKDKKVPSQLFYAEEQVVAEFLSGLFEGDGYLSLDRPGSGDYFEYSTASKELAQGISSLLLRLGVFSIIREKKKAATNTVEKKKRTYYSVFIYGLSNIKRLCKNLRFVGKKAEKLNGLKTLNYKENPNQDLIPEINSNIKDLVKLSGIKVKRFKKISPKLISYYENRCLPSRQGLQEVLSVISEHGNITGLARSIYECLKTIAHSDIYWDEVVSIKKIYSEKWVYDLSVLGNHNFIAQDMIVHNSNIFDSIRWVLGEQSAKSLRGSDMQDVIFNGTDNKDALGMAEVTLAFDNRNRFFAFDHDEVAITRRLFRSGESEYLLNKNTVRLKDISDLLLGTGVGAESYSIVAQGKIDLVLSSKPEERRMVFDEASGITKYKAQKRETARKLEETEQNLLRVNDIIAEVKRQIGSLERQANKARKYKEAFEELKIKEINFAIVQKKELIRQKDELINKLKEMEIKETELLDLIRKQEETIAASQSELRILEDKMMEVKNQVLNLDNSIVRNNEHISFNKERIIELDLNRSFLESQIEEVRGKIIADEQNLNNIRQEYEGLRKNIEEKSQVLSQRESEINNIASAIKTSLDNIADTKRQIMELASKISNTKNQIADFTNKHHVYVARKKRLETEKAKVYEEKVVTETSLTNITQEVENLKNAVNEVNEKINSLKNQLQQENSFLSNVNVDIDNLEKQRLSLESHKEFLLRLKTKYEDISESMNAVIYLDKPPQENMSGLVIKIKEYTNLNEEDSARLGISGLKISGEAKPIELDTQKIDDKIAKIQEILEANKNQKQVKEMQIGELNNALNLHLQDLRNQELALANKESSRTTIAEQFGKINQEEDIIVIELNDVQREISVIEGNVVSCESVLNELSNQQKKCEDSIQQDECSISLNSKLREDVLVVITQTKTELDGLNSRLVTDEETLKILEDTYRREKESLENIDRQIKDAVSKKDLMEQEIRECEENVLKFNQQVLEQNNCLKEFDVKYREISLGSSDAVKQIEFDRKTLDELKNSLYELQMQDKDIDYKYTTLKDRLVQAYKTDLDSCADLESNIDVAVLSGEITSLKQKLDAYGNVNLVAIEEYDELKQRYDFLIQQMNDLTTSKEALHQAILKINRTTKQMFVETFEKVKEEFRNYFRMLFNGGDAQLFLTDESDPLESGIEIICRPPGKKLQNVLLLSGGEKSMSAIALIFAIFKVKPSPFCILDEIDAALDEANVDRFSRMLQQFAKLSQFIVITHNKRTIANANVMYGITMEQSGVSKIVSVKFAETKENKEAQPQQPAASQN